MRKILGFGVVLAVASLTGTARVAYGQPGTGNIATTPGSLVTAPGNSEQAANDAAAANWASALNRAAAANAAGPAQTAPAPSVPGGTTTTTPANTYQAPGMTGTTVNPAGRGAVRTYPGNTTRGIGNAVTGYQAGTPYPGAANMTTYSSNYSAPGYQAGTYPGPSTGATPGYTNRVMPGMAGYNDINPMATTMAPGYYYAGTGGMPYATYNTPGYSSMYGDGYPYNGYASGYGYGYPYNATAPAAPSVGVTYSSAYVAPAGSAANTVRPAQGRYLGIDEESITDANGHRGMKVTNVYPDTAAERAGLQVGDVIYASNGYLTEQRGNLAWIIANAADTRLKMSVKTARDGREHFITAQLP
jgi:hypothetical protein